MDPMSLVSTASSRPMGNIVRPCLKQTNKYNNKTSFVNNSVKQQIKVNNGTARFIQMFLSDVGIHLLRAEDACQLVEY